MEPFASRMEGKYKTYLLDSEPQSAVACESYKLTPVYHLDLSKPSEVHNELDSTVWTDPLGCPCSQTRDCGETWKFYIFLQIVQQFSFLVIVSKQYFSG